MSKAYEKARANMQENNEKIQNLSNVFLKEVQKIGGVFVNGDRENALPSILNLRFEGVENVLLLYNMDLKGVSLAAGSACASASVKPSHVLTAMGLDEKQAKESVRVSLGKENTEEEILKAASLLKETVEKLRGM